MSLAKKYPKEVKQILSKYPPEGKRSAVMPLLFLAQLEDGYINKVAMQDIAQMLEISETEVASIIGFYTFCYRYFYSCYTICHFHDPEAALRFISENGRFW